MSLSASEVRKLSEKDLATFAVLVNPLRTYGDIHFKVFDWLMRKEWDQLLLLPRAHMKSHCVAVWTAWWLTKHPETTIMYVSATMGLAKQQLYAIKQMLESEIYRTYWPKMVHADEMKRAKWTETEIKVDHPLRAEHGVRDPSIFAASVDTNTTGMHADVIVLDDLVVPQNAYTEIGRASVAAAASQLSSILNPGGIVKACGTRYHPKDIYGIFKEQQEEQYNESGDITGTRPVWEVMEHTVEKDGMFIWPRTQCAKSKKWYGFNNQVLARIRSSYKSKGEAAQYYAQYYNNPNDPDSQRLDASKFQYYGREHLKQRGSQWYYKDNLLATYAAMDCAYTTGTRSDYTALAVVGLDAQGFIYILDLDRFKTDKYEDFYQSVIRLHHKWGFRRIRVESNAGANLIARYMQDRVREEGGSVVVDPQRAPGDKDERIAATLEPRYETRTIWHPKDGFIHAYEEEVVLARPAHDDLKDAVAAAIEIAKPPARQHSRESDTVIQAAGRFGGYRG